MNENDEIFLLEDVYDYLFENDVNIGTNFLDTFENAYIDYEDKKIFLPTENGVFEITLKFKKKLDKLES